MVNAYKDVPINDLIEETAKELKKLKELEAPEWSQFVKTGVHKERPPMDNDWWYMRAAAVFKSVEKLGPVGVSKLKTKYGGRKNRGVRPEHFYKGSGKIIRIILQQLEEAKLIKKDEKGVHKGRNITPKGISLLTKVAVKLLGGVKVKKKQEVKVNKKETPEKPKETKEKVEKKTTDKKNE